MTKAEIINLVSEKTGVDKAQVSTTLESFFESVKDTLIDGEALYIRGFGSFVNKKRAEKKARNIAKKTSVLIPAHYIPSFKPAREFVEEVKKNVKV